MRSTCDGGEHRTLSGVDTLPRTRLSKRGGLRADGTTTAAFDDGTGVVAERLRGTVRNGRGRGTLSETMVVTAAATGAKQTCRSGTLHRTAASSPGRIFAGRTSDRRPIVLRRSRDGGGVEGVWVSYYAVCASGGGYAIGEQLVDFPLRSGAFGDSWTYAPDPTLSVAYTLRGRVGAARASGTLRVVVTDKPAQDTCDTTQLSWTARSSKGAKVKRARSEIRVGAAARAHTGTS